jgi:glucan biosynthesis protein
MNNMESPVLKQAVEPENDLKNFIVEHVGNKLNPENQEVTVEMVISVMAEEFPEFVLALAEENWIRGYQQGLDDVEVGKKLAENEQQD